MRKLGSKHPTGAVVSSTHDNPCHSEIPEEFVSDVDAAQMIGSTAATLRRWRREGRHLRYYKIGSSVRYAVSDLERFLLDRVVETKAAGQS